MQNSLQELVDDSIQKSVRDELDLVLLPKQLWCSLKESNDGGTCSEAGWLLNHGHAITSKCTFSSKTALKASLYIYIVVMSWFQTSHITAFIPLAS